MFLVLFKTSKTNYCVIIHETLFRIKNESKPAAFSSDRLLTDVEDMYILS